MCCAGWSTGSGASWSPTPGCWNCWPRCSGALPGSVVWKVSAMLAPANPLTVSQLDRLGASTINVPSDATLGQLAEMRAATRLPIDLYVEAPGGMGGVVRGQETADLVTVAAPMYAKFGLRNSRLPSPR